MTAERAVYLIHRVLSDDEALELMLVQVDAETPGSRRTPPPKIFRIGSYLGREEILAELPAVTIEAKATTPVGAEEPWLELQHSLWVWAFVMETDIELLYLWCMRYAEAMRRLFADRTRWGRGWHGVDVTNTMYTNVFQAGHRLVQGCRIELRVRQFIKEGG